MTATNKTRQDLKILLVEDDDLFREQVVKLLGVYNDIAEAPSLANARNLLAKLSFDVVLLDKTLPDGNGLDLIPLIKAHHPQTVTIVLTGDTNFNLVQKCIDAGATDYLQKSENIVPDLLVRIPIAISRAASERRSAQLADRLRDAFRYEIIGGSAAMAELRSVVQSLKGTLTPILITGESGTGKELIARRLNAVEDQVSRPFQAINCGAIPENLVESELFGHVRGAFSGAVQNQIGKFELANGGDLFLDEIGDLPMPAQTKLLRVLQEGEFSPLGDKRVVRISVRVIAATNKPLEKLVEEGKFREDLYYRLNVFPINTLPLREHPEDIFDLAQLFLTQLGGARLSLADEAKKYLERQQWPGNIRELKNTIERAILLAKRRNSVCIEKADVMIRAQPIPGSASRLLGFSFPKSLNDVSNETFNAFLQAAEREYLRTVLDLCDYSPVETASRLGIGRTTLFRKMTELGLQKRTREPQPGLRVDSSTENDLEAQNES